MQRLIAITAGAITVIVLLVACTSPDRRAPSARSCARRGDPCGDGGDTATGCHTAPDTYTTQRDVEARNSITTSPMLAHY